MQSMAYYNLENINILLFNKGAIRKKKLLKNLNVELATFLLSNKFPFTTI